MPRCKFNSVNKFDSFIQKRDEKYNFLLSFSNLTQHKISNVQLKNFLYTIHYELLYRNYFFVLENIVFLTFSFIMFRPVESNLLLLFVFWIQLTSKLEKVRTHNLSSFYCSKKTFSQYKLH